MKKIDVILFGGQSNMQGQSELLSENAPVAGAYEYRLFGNALLPLQNPVGENIRYDGQKGITYTDEVDQAEWLRAHVTGSACYGHTNMVPSFCRAYVEQTNKTVVAVHIAKGSTEVTDWLPGTDGYRVLLRKAGAALDRVRETYEIERVYFVWLQGESDAIFKRSKADYKDKLTQLATSLCAALPVEKFCVIRVGRFTNDARDDEIIGAQDELCREHPDFLMLTEIATTLNTMAEYMNPYVAGHYSAKGLEKLGDEAGRALGAYRNETK